MEHNAVINRLCEIATDLGAYKAAVIPTGAVETDAIFRTMCASNACGNYGKNWMCPPDAGEIEVLMASLRDYSHVLVYQTVSMLEDSYDFEGMIEAGNAHNRLMCALRKQSGALPLSRALHLGAGGCRMCEVCAKRTNEPCRHPDLAVASLEAYGVNVSQLAKAAGMRYINGQDTVTYFGAIFFNL